MASDAVGLERISRVVGYKIKKGNFQTVSPNLPQRIALLGEANDANQIDLDLTPIQITSAQQAGELYGYGSPIHIQARILFPRSGEGVGGIPVIVYPQAAAVGAAAKVLQITPSGVATGNGTHTLIIAGRGNVDGVPYDINIVSGDTTADITAKISDAINAVLGSPVIASDTDYITTLTSKWKGLTAQEISVTVDTNDDDLGITYAVVQTAAGSGTPSIQSALDSFGNEWVTIVCSCYGAVSSIMDVLEAFNGRPNPISPTGRYVGVIMKPFVALIGSLLDNPTSITDSRKDDLTIAICPAPGSDGLSMEAAANMCVLFAVIEQNSPHLDVAGLSYPDMPTPSLPSEVGSMTDYNNRDAFVKKGCTTVDLKSGRYEVQDFVTTYHPLGEEPPQFRYPRNIMIDLNVRYSYLLKEQINVVDHAIAANDDIVTADKVIKPKQWKQILFALADDLVLRALIVDKNFMTASITVDISTSNPDRIETFFKYKRSGFTRISSTTAEAGFNFGTLN
jgi:phage tail sheath gpL-like